MDYSIKWCNRDQIESVAGNHICDNLPPDVLEHLSNNDSIITGAIAIPDAIAMGVGVESMNMSDHVEFDVPQTSNLAETLAKRLLEGIPLPEVGHTVTWLVDLR